MEERELSEFELIERLAAAMPGGPRLRIGPGDDAAVVEGDGASAVSVDVVVEGVHFTRPQFELAAIGRKGLAAALSDLAAMGADPGEAYLALGIPAGLSGDEVLAIGTGAAEVAARHRVAIAGGDLTRSPTLFLAVTVVGREPPGSRLVPRSGARPGHVIAVTGELGGAGAALILMQGASTGAVGAHEAALLERQHDPPVRLAAGRALAEAGAAAIIDLSDGIGGDARHLAAASACRLEIDVEALPIAPGAIEVAGGGDRALRLALEAGEDYELLVALPPESLESARSAVEAAGSRLTAVGRAVEGEGATFRDAAGHDLAPTGFDQLRSRPG